MLLWHSSEIRLLCHLLVSLFDCILVVCLWVAPFSMLSIQHCCTAAGSERKATSNEQRGDQLLLSIIADTHGRPRRIRNFRTVPLLFLSFFAHIPIFFLSFLLLLFVLPIAATCLLKTLMLQQFMPFS